VAPSISVRPALRWVFAITTATAVGFVAVILAGLSTGFDLHELAGTVLLVELVIALWLAFRLRDLDHRPFRRAGAALAGVIAAGVGGALLATGFLPASYAGLPLVPLAVVIVGAGDGVRVTGSPD
jgi:hypothetical protein